MINITITGVDGVVQTLKRIPQVNDAAVLKLAERCHQLGYQGADKHTKTGALIRSLGPGPRKITGGWSVGHDMQAAPHALFVHWGTKPHVIKPKNKKVLRWASGGGFVFAGAVNHPGYKGDPYLVKAAQTAIKEFEAIINQQYGKL